MNYLIDLDVQRIGSFKSCPTNYFGISIFLVAVYWSISMVVSC